MINALGTNYYNQARREPLGSDGRLAALRKSVATYRRTIAIDSENVAAHHGLGLGYAELARARPGDPVATIEPVPPPVATDDLAALTERIVDPVPPTAERAGAARKLAQAVPAFLASPRQRLESRLNPLHAIVERLGPAQESEGDATLQRAEAQALAATHQALHRLFKPDETAEGRAVAIARRANPAADQNAQSIVIHPLHRPGAPGIDPAPTPASKVVSRGPQP